MTTARNARAGPEPAMAGRRSPGRGWRGPHESGRGPRGPGRGPATVVGRIRGRTTERVRGRGSDRGSATVLVLACLLVLATVAGTLLATSTVSLARRRAATAADLAALAAAADRTGDPATACGLARMFARRNGAELVACRTGGDAVEVVTAVALPPALRLAGPLSATARAGPWLGVSGGAPDAG